MGLELELNGRQHLSLDLGSRGRTLTLNSSFPTIKVVSIKIGTTEYWNSQASLIPSRGELFIYSDYDHTSGGDPIPGMKVADGSAYLIDLPFVGGGIPSTLVDTINEHIQNGSIHVSSSDRENWDSKLSCRLDGENLILTSGTGDSNG